MSQSSQPQRPTTPEECWTLFYSIRTKLRENGQYLHAHARGVIGTLLAEYLNGRNQTDPRTQLAYLSELHKRLELCIEVGRNRTGDNQSNILLVIHSTEENRGLNLLTEGFAGGATPQAAPYWHVSGEASYQIEDYITDTRQDGRIQRLFQGSSPGRGPYFYIDVDVDADHACWNAAQNAHQGEADIVAKVASIAMVASRHFIAGIAAGR